MRTHLREICVPRQEGTLRGGAEDPSDHLSSDRGPDDRTGGEQDPGGRVVQTGEEDIGEVRSVNHSLPLPALPPAPWTPRLLHPRPSPGDWVEGLLLRDGSSTSSHRHPDPVLPPYARSFGGTFPGRGGMRGVTRLRDFRGPFPNREKDFGNLDTWTSTRPRKSEKSRGRPSKRTGTEKILSRDLESPSPSPSVGR